MLVITFDSSRAGRGRPHMAGRRGRGTSGRRPGENPPPHDRRTRRFPPGPRLGLGSCDSAERVLARQSRIAPRLRRSSARGPIPSGPGASRAPRGARRRFRPGLSLAGRAGGELLALADLVRLSASPAALPPGALPPAGSAAPLAALAGPLRAAWPLLPFTDPSDHRRFGHEGGRRGRGLSRTVAAAPARHRCRESESPPAQRRAGRSAARVAFAAGPVRNRGPRSGPAVLRRRVPGMRSRSRGERTPRHSCSHSVRLAADPSASW